MAFYIPENIQGKRCRENRKYYSTGQRRKGMFLKEFRSRRIKQSHAIVTIAGSNADFELARKLIREAVRKYNHLSNSKMSFEIRLANGNPGEKH